jgi:hypothetical protein
MAHCMNITDNKEREKSSSTGASCDMAAIGRVLSDWTSQHLTYFRSMSHKVRRFFKNSNIEHTTFETEVYERAITCLSQDVTTR